MTCDIEFAFKWVNSYRYGVVGRDVCDLGAGLGLAGIAAAICG